MSDPKPEEQEKAPEAESADPGPDQGQAAAEAPEPEAAKPEPKPAAPPEQERVAALEAEAAQLKDQLLRALAEAENVRRRAQRDRADAQKYAAAPMLHDLLTVADNLTRAIQSVPGDEPFEDERLKTLLAGIELTEKELASVFQRHHVTKLEPLGETLDPHRHEAMFEVPDPSTPSGTVVQVVEPGYLLHDRLLRPARVGVAKGGAPAAQAQAPDAAEEAPAADQDEAGDQPGSRIDTSA